MNRLGENGFIVYPRAPRLRPFGSSDRCNPLDQGSSYRRGFRAEAVLPEAWDKLRHDTHSTLDSANEES